MVKIKEFIRRRFFLIGLSFVALIVIGLSFLGPSLFRQTKEEVLGPIITRPIFSQAKIVSQNIIYQLDFPEKPYSPLELPLYQASERSHPKASPISFNLEGEKVVSSTLRAEEIAKLYLSQNNLWAKELDKAEIDIEFLKVGGYEVFKAKNVDEADIFNVLFYPKIENYIILANSPFFPLMEVWVRENGQVQKVADFLANYQQKGTQKYSIISFDQAWQQVLNQRAVITSLSIEQEKYFTSEFKINKISLKKAYLAYFQEQTLPSLLQPIWVFEGETIFEDGTSSGVSLYLPALEEKYYLGSVGLK
ncbi:MAG: hypothetical protein V1858_01725 [Candidatus Gottesmanbacteria bacterium]